MSKIHRVHPDERIRYADPQTGREVIQLTSKANNAKAYFTAPHFVDGGRTLVFCSDRSGTWEVFKLDMKTGQIVQLTDDASLTGVNSRISLCCHPTKPVAYVMAGKNDRIIAIDVEHGGYEQMCRIPDGFFGDLIVISADGSYIGSSYIQDFYNVPNQLMTRYPGEIYGGGIEYKYRHPSSVVFTVDTASGRAETVWGELEYCDHVQIPQKNPDRIVFCHGNTNAAQRMWIVERVDYPCKKPKPLVPQDPIGEAVGHEFACADGWIGYQYATFTGGYRKGRVDYFSFVNPATDAVQNYRLPGPRPGHFQCTTDRKRVIADCDSLPGHPEDWSGYIKLMARYELTDGKAVPTVLCRHDSSFKTHESHPHPVFTPDEKHVVWASDRGGSTHLYMTRFED